MDEFTPGYYIVEMMGHQSHIGAVRIVNVAGVGMLEVYVMTPPPYKKLIYPNALYALTPITESEHEQHVVTRSVQRNILMGTNQNEPEPIEDPLTELASELWE